ncbi:hypothetical protein BGX21_002239, partial [Mortierella sp. AD011]
SPESKIRIDVYSTHNTPIRYYYSNVTNPDTAHRKLASWLKKLGDETRARFYIDGNPTMEKRQIHVDRHQSRQKALVEAAATIIKLEDRLVAKLRIHKRHVTDAYKNLSQPFRWSIEHRSSFVKYMRNEGHDTVLCPTG